MHKQTQLQQTLLVEAKEKKTYFPPTLDVVTVELEYGIAAGSAAVSPLTVNGDVDQVQTDWNGNDDTTIHTEY